MLIRFVPLFATFTLVVVFAGCGVQSGEVTGENVLTAELVVPPAEQEIVETPTATRIPSTATPQPPKATSVMPQADVTEPKLNVSIANRGYNALGSDAAPITMFEFSDFL